MPAPGGPAARRRPPPGPLPGRQRCRCALRAAELLRPPARCRRRPRTASQRPEPGEAGPVLGGARTGRALPRAAGIPVARRAELQLVPPHRRRSLRCPPVHLERPGLYFCRPRRKEPRAAVRLGLPMQVQARVTEGKGGERGKETPNPPCPVPLPGIRCPPSPGARRQLGAAAAGQRRSAPAGHPAGGRGSRRGCLPEPAGRRRALVAAKERRGRRGCGQAALPGAAAGSRRRSRRPGDAAAGEGAPARIAAAGPPREGRGRGALRWARLLPINYRARVFPPFFFPFFSSSLPVSFAFLLPDKLNKRWKLCVCLCRGGGDVTSNYDFSGNQRITRDSPSSYDASRERGCPPPQPRAQKGPPPGTRGCLLAPAGAQPLGVRRGSRRGSAGPGRRWPGAAAAP